MTVAPQRPVLIVDLSKRFGGTNVRVLALARRLDGNHPYGVAVLAGSPLHERLQAEKLRALAVPFGRGDPRVLPYLVRGIRRGSYGVVDAHNPQSQLWAGLAAAVAGTPSVTTVHSAYRDEHAGSARGRAYEAVLRLNRRAGARFVAVSDTIRAYLRRLGVPEERITVVENGLAPRPAVGPADGVREALGWSTDVFVVTSVGRLEPVKGHELLVEAVRQLAPGRSTLRCLIVGDGRRRRALEAHVRAAGLDDRIRLVGFRDDVGPLLAASDAFCLPSRSEGLPYALLEACAHGLPIIATAVGEMGALLEDGRTARIVPTDDAEAVAGAIAWLMDHEHEARALGDAASALADRRFGAERMVAETLEVYAA